MLTMGLDEAGRGCVLGPLVVGGYCLPAEDIPRLAEAGATDSKKLSAKRREALIAPLDALGTWELRHISPAEIDAGNINTLEELAFAELILAHRPGHVIIDAPCHPKGIPAFIKRLLGRLDYVPKLTVEPKADLNYPPCGAASIFAKVHRDAEIHKLGAGSGYPSDPVTRAWIQGFMQRGEELPPSVRRRWGTVSALAQQTLFG